MKYTKQQNELLKKFAQLHDELDKIDYNDIDKKGLPEFGGDENTIQEYIEMQQNTLMNIEDQLELDIQDIEEQLLESGLEIINELVKTENGYKWIYSFKQL
jgi:hypothetical protein